MPYLSFPKTDKARSEALEYLVGKCYGEDGNPTPQALAIFSTRILDGLKPTTLSFKTEVGQRGSALVEQSLLTQDKVAALDVARMYVSHFIRVFNLGVAREVYPASARAFYGLDISQEDLPPLVAEADVIHWGDNIETGDAARIAAGGAPMSNPTAAEVKTKISLLKELRIQQSEKKENYDKEQEDVETMRPTVDELIRDAWDEVQFHFRKSTDPSRRRKCAEWGVVYVSRPGEEVESYSGPVNPDTKLKVAEGSFAGKAAYLSNPGEVDLKFWLAASENDPMPPTALTVVSGDVIESLPMSELGNETLPLLMCYNASADKLGYYVIEIRKA